MKTEKTLASILLLLTLATPCAFPLTPVKDSSEDLFWTQPMTVHDYKKNSDLHNIAVSMLALSELEFVRLGDDLAHFTLRKPRHPISNSLDSVDSFYRKLPQIEPVERTEQLFDALQLRQLSLSDARIMGALLSGQGMGGVTPIMQVRIYKTLVCVEDILYDLDGAVMFPLNWEISKLRGQPTRIKSLGYAVDGLGYLRWKIFTGLKAFNRELVRFGSELINSVEKSHDAMIRHKRIKANRHSLIYSKMPFAVYRANQRYLKGRKKIAFGGTLDGWYDLSVRHPQIWLAPAREEKIRLGQTLPAQNPDQEVIVAAEYATWVKVPKELKQYVITPDELVSMIRQYEPLAANPTKV